MTTQRGLEIWDDGRIKYAIDDESMMTWDEFGEENDPMLDALDVQVLMLRMRDDMQQRIEELEIANKNFESIQEGYRQRMNELEDENAKLRGKCMCRCDACKYCEQLLEDTNAVDG